MAATAISVVQAGPVGVAGVPASVTPDATNGNVYPNPGGTPTVLTVTNSSGSSITVTFTLPPSQYNGFGSIGTTQVFTVPTTTTRTWCLEPAAYNNANGQVQFIVSSSTTVTASVTAYNRAFP